MFLHTHARTHSLVLVLPATFDSILARFFIYTWRIPLITILRLILFCFIRHAFDLIWTLMVGSDVYLVLTVSFHKNIFWNITCLCHCEIISSQKNGFGLLFFYRLRLTQNSLVSSDLKFLDMGLFFFSFIVSLRSSFFVFFFFFSSLSL